MLFSSNSGGVAWLAVFLGNPGPRYAFTRHNAGFMAADAGEAVSQAARFYKLDPSHVIVVSDEVSLPIGKLRVRAKGSAGGHNGLKSVITCLGTDQFPRIRIGVGAPPHPDYDMADWVLSSFKNQDAEEMAKAAERAAAAVECYIRSGPERTMNLFN